MNKYAKKVRSKALQRKAIRLKELNRRKKLRGSGYNDRLEAKVIIQYKQHTQYTQY